MTQQVCRPEYFTVIQGEDRTLPMRIMNTDLTAFVLTDVTEIRARFMKQDGKILEKRYSDNQVNIIDVQQGRITVSLTENETPLMMLGERKDFTVLVDKGARATSSIMSAVLTADLPGSIGNDITIIFDGNITIHNAMIVWNTAHPTNLVELTSGDDTQKPLAQTLVLSGGSNNRRIANFSRAISIVKPSV